MIEPKIKLGHKVRDMVTGFEGTATRRITALNGCVQYAVRPRMKEGEDKMPVGSVIDQQQLELVDEEPILKEKSVSVEFDLGDKVIHPMTGFKGTITVMIENLDGTVELGVKPPMKKGEDQKMPDAVAIFHDQLTYWDGEEPVEIEKKSTGGTIQDLKGMNIS